MPLSPMSFTPINIQCNNHHRPRRKIRQKRNNRPLHQPLRLHYGDEAKIGPFVEIQKNATIGNRCKIQSHTFICEGVSIEDEVMVGHGVMFINDLDPAAVNADGSLKTEADWKCIPTFIKKRASIGSNATILCGVTIGEGALSGQARLSPKMYHPIWLWWAIRLVS